MKNKLLTLATCIVMSISITSCITHYIPPPINNPMLSHATEINVSLSGTVGVATGMRNINVAYSPIEHLGLGYSYNSYSADFESNINGTVQKDQLYKGNYNELLGGYYRGFGKYGLLELYSGIGLGKSNYNYINYFSSNGTDGQSQLAHTRLFIMPAIGFKFRHFQVSYGIKLSRLNYHKVSYTNITYNDLITEVTRIGKKSYLFSDNAITFKFGGENLQGLVQIGATSQLLGNYISYDPARFTVGLQYQFNINP